MTFGFRSPLDRQHARAGCARSMASAYAVAAACVLTGCATTPRATQEPPTPVAVDVGATEGETTRASSALHGAVLLLSDELVVWAKTSDDGHALTFLHVEDDGSTVRRERSSGPWSTPMRIAHVVARGSHEIYVLGELDGRANVERWELSRIVGEPFVSIQPSSTPVGHASAPLPIVEFGKHLGAESAVTPKRSVVRTLVVDTQLVGELWWLLVDPEARYALIGTGEPSTVHQVQFEPRVASPRLVRIGDESSSPQLARTISIQLAQHVDDGRLLIVSALDAQGGLERTVFPDATNDALFEPCFALDDDAWKARGNDGVVWYRPTFVDWTSP